MAPPPQDYQDSWARVFAYAWSQDPNDFLRRLNKDPRATLEAIDCSGEPASLVEASKTILRYVNDPDSEEGFLALPPPPDALRTTDEDALYNYAKQDGLYGVLRIS
jgi:hypothetical protein